MATPPKTIFVSSRERYALYSMANQQIARDDGEAQMVSSAWSKDEWNLVEIQALALTPTFAGLVSFTDDQVEMELSETSIHYAIAVLSMPKPAGLLTYLMPLKNKLNAAVNTLGD